MLGSYQWYSNSAPLCKRKATKRRGKRGNEYSRTSGEEKTRKKKKESRVKEKGQNKSTPLSNVEIVFTMTVILASYLDFKARFSSDKHSKFKKIK